MSSTPTLWTLGSLRAESWGQVGWAHPDIPHQVYIGNEVAKGSSSNPKGPDAVGTLAEHSHVEVLPELSQKALAQGTDTSLAWGVLGVGQEGPVGERKQCKNKHEGTQHLEGLGELYLSPQRFDEKGEGYGEDATPSRHYTIGQTQAALEVVAQDDERWLKCEGTATTKENPIGEVTQA